MTKKYSLPLKKINKVKLDKMIARGYHLANFRKFK